MDNDRISLELRSLNRFRSPRFVIEAALLGATHTFDLEGRSYSVTLPPASETLNENSKRVELYSEREEGDGKMHLSYWIHDVDFSVSVPNRISLPKDVLGRPVNAYALLQKPEQSALEALAEECHDVSLHSYDFWLRTMRWRTQQPLLGREESIKFKSMETGWTTYLLDCDSGHKVWGGKQTFMVRGNSEVTQADWAATQQCLSSSSIPPIAVNLYADACFHMSNGDFERAVADAVVAAESFIRSKIQESLPANAGKKLKKYIDKANIGHAMKALFPEAIASMGADPITIPSEIQHLFDARNALFHSGTMQNLSSEQCSKYVESVRSLIAPLFFDATD